MATGRTLGEAWVAIRPDTSAFRTTVDAELRKSLAGLKPTIQVTVNLNADAARMRTQLAAKLKTASQGLQANVNVGVNTASLAKTEAAIKAATAKDANVNIGGTINPALYTQIAALRDRLTNMIVTTDDRQAESEIDVLDAKAEVLSQKLSGIKTSIGAAQAVAEMAALNAAADKLNAKMDAKGSANIVDSLGLTLAQSQFKRLDEQTKQLGADIDKALSPTGITIGKVTEGTKEELTTLRTSLDAIGDEILRIKSSGGITSADDVARVKQLSSNLTSLSGAVAATGLSISNASGSYHGWVNTLISMARVQIPLFNGALEDMLPHFLAFASGTHMMIEAVVEFSAIWVPAAVALGVFAVAAAKATYEVYSDVKNMAVAASGTGQEFEGMTKKMGKSMSQLAQPYVFEAYGLALIALQKNSTTTAGVIQSVGSTIDKWITEAVMAYDKGTGKLAQSGASDLAVLGDSFKQFGTLLQGLMKLAPGYAKDLLALGDGVLHFASAVVNSPIAQTIGSWFLKLHGAIFYLGLFATLGTKIAQAWLSPLARINALSGAFGKLGIEASGTQGKIGKLGSALVAGWNQGTGKLTEAVDQTSSDIEKGLAVAFTSNGPITAINKQSSEIKTALSEGVDDTVENTGSKFSGLTSAISGAMGTAVSKVEQGAKGLKGALSGMLDSLGINPWLLGIAALGVAFYELDTHIHNADTAAQDFGQAAATALGNSTISTFGTTMQLQMKYAEAGLAGANEKVAAYTKLMNGANSATTVAVTGFQQELGPIISVGAGLNYLTGNAAAWQTTVNNLKSTNTAFTNNLKLVAKTAGVDLPTAMNLATQAGLSVSDMETTNSTTAMENALQVEALNKSYQSLVTGVGGVTVAYEAMNVENSTTLKNAQSVAEAFAAYTTLMTSGENALDTFVQGQATLTSDLAAAGDAVTNTVTKFGTLTDSSGAAGKALDGLSANSITANQAFLTQVNNAQANYGALIQLAAASGNTATAQNQLSTAGKAMISILMQTAGGSQSAMQQVYSLAQTFGYTGNDTLPNLVKWLGKTSYTMADVQTATVGLTAGAGNLKDASQELSGALQTQLNAAMSESIFLAEGGQTAFNNLATAIKNYNKAPSAANQQALLSAGNAVSKMLIQTTGNAQAAEPVLQNYLQQLGVGPAKAKALADSILGLGGSIPKATSAVATLSDTVQRLSKSSGTPIADFQLLQDTMGKTNFAKFVSGGNSAATTVSLLATGLNLTQRQASGVWSAFQKDNLLALAGHTTQAKDAFVKLLGQLGITPSIADAVWAALEKGEPTAQALASAIGGTSAQFKDWAKQAGTSTTDAQNLWTKLASNNFNLLGGDLDTNKQKFFDWAKQVGIGQTAANNLWQQLLKNNLPTINKEVGGNQQQFYNLMNQLGETKQQAQELWDTLRKAPNVKATVSVDVSAGGSMMASAVVNGKATPVAGVQFSGSGGPALRNYATGGKIPGWHNTGDNLLAASPVGPIALQGGETIVPKALSTHPAFTDFASTHGIPGFASGGLVGSQGFAQAGTYVAQNSADIATAGSTGASDIGAGFAAGVADAVKAAYAGTGGSASGQAILADAESYKGHKYVWGGDSNPEQGWDCSSFVGYVLGHDFHMMLPNNTQWNPNVHGPVASTYNKEPNFHLVSHNVNDIQAGDLLVEDSGGHVGFGVGPNKMFSAYGTAYGTIFSDAAHMTNIYRDGSTASAGALLTSGNPVSNAVSALVDKAVSASPVLAQLFPQLNAQYGGDPGTAVAGTANQNGSAIFSYLMQNMGMTATAAAGAIASIYGESGWNPESIQKGGSGGGLIQWSPYTQYGIPITGNATADLDAQLPLIVKFVQDSGDDSVIAAMNKADSVAAAAQLWGKGVERYGVNDVTNSGISLATAIMNDYLASHKTAAAAASAGTQATIAANGTVGRAMGGLIPGFASGGSLSTLQSEHSTYATDYATYKADYAEYVAKYNTAIAKEKTASDTTMKQYYANEAATYAADIKKYQADMTKYAGKISSVDASIGGITGAKLTMPKPTNDAMKLAEAICEAPYLNKLMSASGSVSPLGWAMQPMLGDLMIAARMAPTYWLGQPATNTQATSVQANWIAAMEAVGSYFNGQPIGVQASQLAGKLTGIHGRATDGVRQSFMTGGTVMEDVYGFGGTSGSPYKFHAGDQLVAPAIAATSNNGSGWTQEDRMIMIGLLNEAKTANQLARQQPVQYARVLNQNVGRRVRLQGQVILLFVGFNGVTILAKNLALTKFVP